jgi:hypothetical protein
LTPQKAIFNPPKSHLKIKTFPHNGTTPAALAGWSMQAAGETKKESEVTHQRTKLTKENRTKIFA